MTKKYIIGVIISVVVLTCNQVFIQYWLQKKKEDAEIINIAGRQRMLSQRINLELYKIHNDHTNTETLEKLEKQWLDAHEMLLHGNESLNFTGVEDTKSLALLNGLTSRMKSIANDISKERYLSETSLKDLSVKLDLFLVEMDITVKALENSANRKLTFIIITEIILALISIGVIVAEVLLIYKPISKRLEEQVLEIQKSEVELKLKNTKLEKIAQIQSHKLRKPLANILGLVHLIEFDDREELNDLYLEKLKHCAEELDETISSIVNQTKTVDKTVNKEDAL
ncbi:hypothetical protein NBRC110019_08730 [Neptunitalea chrysea]|uniref:NarX-like N-terminal domain-containing protein n=1 Tax=Neptunitalea chrysea TaxID=1647581 RepID=A0A9W6B3J5_9FLAO|nr:type IV pili methyl-accepting chemotaxis transducer N-terminal domain-containing protein [Neptunitalea chrysea]GLB51834.1 hypothetical protein NBRC110019_08730 [Neptunitalea chrysea]